MSEVNAVYGPMSAISPEPSSAYATPVERMARRLLSLMTPSDTAEALRLLRDTEDQHRRAEWYFLMGVCALRRGYVADAQAHLDHACALCTADDGQEYDALYESVQNAFEKRRSEDDDRNARAHSCFSGVDCLDCCDCAGCCDCDGSDGCCDCCDCGDGCN